MDDGNPELLGLINLAESIHLLEPDGPPVACFWQGGPPRPWRMSRRYRLAMWLRGRRMVARERLALKLAPWLEPDDRW